MPMTLQQRFGASAALNSGVLSITVAELTGLSGATPTADQILAAIILHNKLNQPSTAADTATIGVVIDDPFKSFARNDTQIAHQYNVSLYESAGSIAALDPDNVVS